ncbi:hypothetical protein C9I57_29630 [Trinickia symbiotica]|uniref:Uncharacterized protein n=1 Tax=Trinickia symbiotica TaxID=863227 RepID=A0A2T3XKQ6_9BURK|nr:hypothetical protein C9I57_29630 [Trinickia symbiotica]
MAISASRLPEGADREAGHAGCVKPRGKRHRWEAVPQRPGAYARGAGDGIALALKRRPGPIADRSCIAIDEIEY